jgi:hypothetical protein
VNFGGKKDLPLFNIEFYSTLLATLVLIATTGCAADGEKVSSPQGQTAPAASAEPQNTSGHPTEKELEAAKKAVEAGPLPGPPVPQVGTPAPPPAGGETQVSSPKLPQTP